MMVAVLNSSSVVSDKDLETMVAALNEQMVHDVAPAWKRTPTLSHVGGRAYIHHLVVDTDKDVQGALAYHSVGKDGHPVLVTMAQNVLDSGATMLGPDGVCSAMAHENIEAFIDPYCNDVTQGPKGYYWHEACDAVQSQDYTHGTASDPKPYVSNFVLPHWFNPDSPDDVLDWERRLNRPFEVGPKGYQVVSQCGNEQQIGGRRLRRAAVLLASDGRQVDAGPNAWRTLLLTGIGQ